MRIGYWTTACFEPEIEAISKEVFQLANHFQGSFVFGMSPHYVFRASWGNRSIGFHNAFDPVLRLIIPMIESACDIGHVYGDPSPWTFKKTLGAKPIVTTVASEKGLPDADFLGRCRKVIVQTSSYYKRLIGIGVEKEKLELVYPGVDQRLFNPGVRTDRPTRGTPKVLFATAPRSEAELQKRGVYLLLEAAKLNQAVRYHLLYRNWANGYTSLAATRKRLETQALANVVLTSSIVADMHAVYGNNDFTIIPYTTPDGGKECPNSALEGLACGLPTLISSAASFSDFVNDNKCGVVFDPTPSGLVQAIEIGMCRYLELSNNAIAAAQKWFSLERTFTRTAEIYQSIYSH